MACMKLETATLTIRADCRLQSLVFEAVPVYHRLSLGHHSDDTRLDAGATNCGAGTVALFRDNSFISKTSNVCPEQGLLKRRDMSYT